MKFAILLAFLTIAACDDSTGPVDLPGVYEIISVSDRTAFPIYLGSQVTWNDYLDQAGTYETWLVGGELYVYGTDYIFQPVIRLKWTGVRFLGQDNGEAISPYLMDCGDYTVTGRTVVFENRRMSLGSAPLAPVSLYPGNGTVSGRRLQTTGYFSVYRNAELASQVQTITFVRTDKPLPIRSRSSVDGCLVPD